jgi:hypothetical protein
MSRAANKVQKPAKSRVFDIIAQLPGGQSASLINTLRNLARSGAHAGGD